MTGQQSAILMGVILLLTSLPFIVNRKSSIKAYSKIIDNTPLVQVGGAVGAFLTTLLLVHHFRISKDLAGIVALFAWIGLFESILYVWAPERIAKFMRKKFFPNETLIILSGLIGTVLGGWMLIRGLGL